MAKISHYELYTDKGNGWLLISRYSAEDRTTAFNLAKDEEAEGNGVKIIKEVFDSSDNSYIESIEYIKIPKDTKAKDTYVHKNKVHAKESADVVNEKINMPKATKAALTLITIILLTAVAVNIIGSLFLPVLEMIIPPHLVNKVFFIGMFLSFIFIALPLVLKKVSWDDLSISAFNFSKASDQSFYDKAQGVDFRYNLNEDFADNKTPTLPEALMSEKRQIINFIAQVLSILNFCSMTPFNKLGIKLIIYGGILEFAIGKKLESPKINSLLSEAFAIIDGNNHDLVAFYQAKRSYKDNKSAIYLTGVGAFLMDKFLAKQAFDDAFLTKTFQKWEEQNEANDYIEPPVIETPKPQTINIVSIKYGKKTFSNNTQENSSNLNELKEIALAASNKFSGQNFTQKEEFISVSFNELSIAIVFAKEVLNNLKAFFASQQDEDVIYNAKVNIVKQQDNDTTAYIKDVFEHTNDDEILITANVANEAEAQTKLQFESIGTKTMQSKQKTLELFKIL